MSEMSRENIGLRDDVRRLLAELAAAKGEAERLRLFVSEQLCECHDEYGKRRLTPCERCQLLYGCETWEQFENAAEQEGK